MWSTCFANAEQDAFLRIRRFLELLIQPRFELLHESSVQRLATQVVVRVLQILCLVDGFTHFFVDLAHHVPVHQLELVVIILLPKYRVTFY
jgi:hypothetical protein